MKKQVFAALILGMAVVLTACGNDEGTGASGANFNEQDVTFVQGMIPHHRQAVEMSELATTRASSTQVKDLATTIQAAQDPEIKAMENWLKDWGKPVPEDGISGMDHGSDGGKSMDGMMSEDDMKSLEGSSGEEFDTMFLAMMIKHHEGAISMADAELADGKNDEAVALAEAIIADQTTEIATMKDLLTS
ncbi:MAG: DUF305 domain-containing protein [Actinomycetota bacterium]|nr:DUF305 domain-containing protein [Actinomycetota bacterium]